MSGTDNPEGAKEAQGGQSTPQNDPNMSQFGTQVSSPSTITQADMELAVRRAESRVGQIWRDKMNEAEIKDNKDNQDALTAIRARQAAETLRAQADDRILEAEEKEKKANKVLFDATTLLAKSKADTLAKEHQVDVAKLLKYSGGNVDLMEEIAKDLPKIGSEPATPEVTPISPDSGKSAGGSSSSLKSLSGQDTKKMNLKELAEHKKALEVHAKGASMTG